MSKIKRLICLVIGHDIGLQLGFPWYCERCGASVIPPQVQKRRGE